MSDAAPVMECLLSRRSVRRFADEPVPDGAVREIVRAACAGP